MLNFETPCTKHIKCSQGIILCKSLREIPIQLQVISNSNNLTTAFKDVSCLERFQSLRDMKMKIKELSDKSFKIRN